MLNWSAFDDAYPTHLCLYGYSIEREQTKLSSWVSYNEAYCPYHVARHCDLVVRGANGRYPRNPTIVILIYTTKLYAITDCGIAFTKLNAGLNTKSDSTQDVDLKHTFIFKSQQEINTENDRNFHYG